MKGFARLSGFLRIARPAWIVGGKKGDKRGCAKKGELTQPPPCFGYAYGSPSRNALLRSSRSFHTFSVPSSVGR